ETVDQGGLDEPSLLATSFEARRAPTAEDLAAFAFRRLDRGRHLVEVLAGNEGALLGRRIERIADAQRAGPCDQAVLDGLVDAALDEDARAAEADLALVLERGPRRAVDGLVEIGVGEDEIGVLAAELQRRFHEAP